MMSGGTITFKPPEFNGEGGEAINLWMMKFKAYAQDKKFHMALLPMFDTKLPPLESMTLSEAVAAEKAMIDALDANGKAMRALIHALVQPRDVRKIQVEMRRDPTIYPNGKAWKVWEALQKQYLPRDATAEAEFESALLTA